MKGIMFNDTYGLETAVLNGTKTRTWRADKKPRYEVGEVVAIKQCYCRVLGENKKHLYSKVNMNDLVNKIMLSAGWRNKMFVKNELMPHKIRITSVKKCMLQDLTEDECFKEGIIQGSVYGFNYKKKGWTIKSLTAFKAFEHLIDDLNGKGYWKSNPEGYAYEFELVE